MSKQSWKGSTLLNPEPPVLVSCGGLDKPNLITIGWTGTICTQPSMVSISVRPERYSHHLIKESGQFAINLPTEQLVRAVDWCGVKSGRDVDKFAACGLHLFHGLDHRRARAGLTKGNKGIVEIACQKFILHSCSYFSILTLSGRFASSSPKGRAFDIIGNFPKTVKTSHFGGGGIAQAMTERVRMFS